jgi:hypothetical protein
MFDLLEGKKKEFKDQEFCFQRSSLQVSARRKHIFLFVSNCLRKILGILVK